MNSIEVCFSPHSFPLHQHEDSIVVVIDVLRATSTISAALYHGVERILPVASVHEARNFQSKGFLCAAERQAQRVEGFDLGNSPSEYMNPDLKGKIIVFTTTNGTQAIRAARGAYRIVLGAFVNMSILCNWLSLQQRNIIVLCAGWKDFFNIEDTLCAGAIAQKLEQTSKFEIIHDSTVASIALYELAANDIHAFMEKSSHFKRLEKLRHSDDVKYCLSPDLAPVIPVLEGNYIVPLKSVK